MRIQSNKRLATDIRRRMEQRHLRGTVTRETFDRLSDVELIQMYLRYKQQRTDLGAKRRAEKE